MAFTDETIPLKPDQEIFILTLQPVPTLSPVIRLGEQDAGNSSAEPSLSRWQARLHCLSSGETITLHRLDDLPAAISEIMQGRLFQGRGSLR